MRVSECYYQQRNNMKNPENASGFKLNLSAARGIKWEIHVFLRTIEGSLFTAVIPSYEGSVWRKKVASALQEKESNMDVGQSDFTDPPPSVKYVIGSPCARYQRLPKSRLMSAGLWSRHGARVKRKIFEEKENGRRRNMGLADFASCRQCYIFIMSYISGTYSII